MNFNFKISKEDHVGMIVTEYVDDKPNCVWELEFIKKRIHMSEETKERHSKHSITRVVNWLMFHHSELLL